MAEGGAPRARGGATLSLLSVCVFLTGASVLAAEVAWGRILLRTLGSTSLSVAALTAGILGGLGAGALLGERLLRSRSIDPLTAFGCAEVAGASSILLFPFLSGTLDLFLTLPGGALIAVLAAGAAALPWGAAFPFAVAAVPEAERPRGVRLLYGWNAVGAAVGAAATGLAGIPILGERGVSLLAAAVEALVGLGAIALALPLRAEAVREAPDSPPFSRRKPGARPDVFESLFVVLAGLCVLYWEVLWTRILALTVGATVHSFSLIAASVLLGIGAGSLLLAGPTVRRSLPAILPLLAACLFILGWLAVPRLPDGYLAAVRALGAPPWIVGPLGAAAAAFLPNLLMGALFPSTVAPLADRAGSLYALSSAGSIAGAFLGGPVAASLLGLEGSYIAGILLLAALTISGSLLPEGTCPGYVFRMAIAAVLIGLVAFYAAWSAPWDPRRLLSGVYQWSAEDLASLPLDEAIASREVIALERGRDVIVSVEVDQAANTVYVRGNGKVEGSVPIDPARPSLADMPTQTLLGEIPGVLLGGPGRKMLLVGLGSGVTAGALERASGGAAIDLIEIEEAYLRAIESPAVRWRLQAYLPAGLAAGGEAFRVHIGDARRLLSAELRGRRWDAIVSQPSEPWLPGAAPLFTVEFFELAASRLEPGGAFFQWLQIYKLDFESVGLLVRTFRRVFPRVFVIRPRGTGEIILAGSAGVLAIEKLMDPPLLEWAGLARIEAPADRLAAFLAGPGGVDRWVGLDPSLDVNTDARGELQYRVTRSLDLPRDVAGENLARLRAIAGEDPVTRYLPARLRADASILRLLAARNARLGDHAEALAIIRDDASSEAAAIRDRIEKREPGRELPGGDDPDSGGDGGGRGDGKAGRP